MTDITTGAILAQSRQATSADRNDLDELSALTAAYVQTFDIHPPYFAFTLTPPMAYGSRDRSVAGAPILIGGPDSLSATTYAIYKVSQAGVASDFIHNAAIADLLTAPYSNQLMGLALDTSDRIYAAFVRSDQQAITLRRFTAAGAFDADFTANVDTSLGSASNFLPSTSPRTTTWGSISQDGRYYYVGQGWQPTFAGYPTTVAGVTLMEYDLQNSMASRQVKTYTFVQDSATGPSHGASQIYSTVIDDVTEDIWVSRWEVNRPVGYDPAFPDINSQETHAYVDRVRVSDGVTLNTYDISGADPAWSGIGIAGNNFTGAAQQMHVADAVLYGQLLYRNQPTTPADHVRFFRLEMATGAIAILSDFDDTYTLQRTNSFPFVIYGEPAAVAARRRRGGFPAFIS